MLLQQLKNPILVCTSALTLTLLPLAPALSNRPLFAVTRKQGRL